MPCLAAFSEHARLFEKGFEEDHIFEGPLSMISPLFDQDSDFLN
jgi:hypothetical protein